MPGPPDTTISALETTLFLRADAGVTTTEAGLQRLHGIPFTKNKSVCKRREKGKEKRRGNLKKKEKQMALIGKNIFKKDILWKGGEAHN